MADRDPAEQQLDTERADDRSDDESHPEKGGNTGVEDSIKASEDNQSIVSPDDYPDKATPKPD